MNILIGNDTCWIFLWPWIWPLTLFSWSLYKRLVSRVLLNIQLRNQLRIHKVLNILLILNLILFILSMPVSYRTTGPMFFYSKAYIISDHLSVDSKTTYFNLTTNLSVLTKHSEHYELLQYYQILPDSDIISIQ